MELEAVKLLAGAIALLPILGVGIGLGLIFGTYYEAISRNPSTEPILFKNLIFGFAITEALAIFSLGISLIILFVL
ncbi:MAG: F0F1 ATP synthase subunit C [Alphaproteobacteria bacterium]|nr:F0F1 ATP synthase subunit C [Alphaproteobacteria bacterium]